MVKVGVHVLIKKERLLDDQICHTVIQQLQCAAEMVLGPSKNKGGSISVLAC